MNIENLYSISSIQEEIEAAVTYYRSLGESDQIVADSFTIVDEVHDCLELFDRLNETLTASWDIMYDQAAKYAREYGNLDVTQRYVTEDGYTLGPWLSTQRLVRAGKAVGVLTPDRIAKLDALGMRWESLADRNWEKYYAAAKKYRESHGDLRVHFEYVTDDGIPLGNWIATMRKSRKSGIRTSYLTPERIELLDALGMTWDVPDFVFESYYASALAWYRAHGTLDVPSQYVDPDGLKLGRWLAQLRTKRRKGTLALSDGQIARLDELGMTWGSRLDSAWESGFRHAAEYYETHHDLLVPPSWKSPDGFRLGDWVSNQRERWREGGIRPERKQRLESLAMVWELPDSWDVRYALAERYFRENGNLNVPADYVLDGVWLGRWLDEQRKNRANLPPERVEKLDRLGIFWGNRLERLWEEGFSHARDYAREYRNLRVPKAYVSPDGFKLGSWITDQRVKARAGKMKPERKLQLDSLGMPW